jgi:glucokinase
MMGRRKVAIGVDIGGTKISAGIVGGEGLVYASPLEKFYKKFPTEE